MGEARPGGGGGPEEPGLRFGRVLAAKNEF
jgi:hypothetical protein